MFLDTFINLFKVSPLGLFIPLAPLAAAAQAVVPRDGKFEASWTLAGQPGNPFDPADNDVDVVFAGLPL